MRAIDDAGDSPESFAIKLDSILTLPRERALFTHERADQEKLDFIMEVRQARMHVFGECVSCQVVVTRKCHSIGLDPKSIKKVVVNIRKRLREAGKRKKVSFRYSFIWSVN